MKLLAVTSCPNGVAHTYMAAECLKRAAKELDIEIKVETQGSIGVENELTQDEIWEADGIIVAVDKTVSMNRFYGKRVVEARVGEAIHEPKQLIERFYLNHVSVYGSSASTQNDGTKKRITVQTSIYRSLMNGVSYMIPFVVIGGLLIALSLAFGGQASEAGLVTPKDSFWSNILKIGEAAFTFIIPILSGFIAVSIADRPALAPGMIGGYIAANGHFYNSSAGAGFIGGIIAGFLAGYTVKSVKKIKVPKIFQPVMPILIIPVLSALFVCCMFVFVIGSPISSLMTSLTAWLNSMQHTSSIVLAIILGGMIAFDMGGPVNKVAFLFGSSMILQGNMEIMGAIAVAICVPPLGMGLATLLKKNKYNDEEQEAGKAAIAMGLVGITEGAIPFASKDPLRVIPSIMMGSIVGAIVAMIGGVTDRVPHGGPIVVVLQAVGHPIMFFVAVGLGMLTTAFMVNSLKKQIIESSSTSKPYVSESAAVTKEV